MATLTWGPPPPPGPKPLARLGEQQGQVAGAADGERDPAHTVGGDRGGHGLQDEQGEAGQCRAPQGHGQRVDGEGNRADTGDGEELDAEGDTDRRGVTLDVGPSGSHEVGQPIQ